MTQIVDALSLPSQNVPEALRTETYFDLNAHAFRHSELLRNPALSSVAAVINGIGEYVTQWLDTTLPALPTDGAAETLVDEAPAHAFCSGRFRVVVARGARFEPSSIIGVRRDENPNTLYIGHGAHVHGDVCLSHGSIHVGDGTLIERGATVKGPAILGENNQVRSGAYLRENVLIGDGGTFRGELKNVVMLDRASYVHPCYVADSLCGYKSHFGAQAVTANFGIFEGVRETERPRNVRLRLQDTVYDLGRPWFGAVIGDFCQVGCNSVMDPGTFLRPSTIVYPLTRLSSGVYGPNVVLKNKPLAHGIIESAPLIRISEQAEKTEK